MAQETKHHLYHKNIPSRFIQNNTRAFDKFYSFERFQYMRQIIDFIGTSILDIGCNNGFFIFEALDQGAIRAIGYEGNHGSQNEFYHYIQQTNEPIKLVPEYFNFSDISPQYFDITFLLNVLHHVGDDFGDPQLSKEKALIQIIDSLHSIAKQTNILIFQLGFNWKGNINAPLFQHGSKREMIEFIRLHLKNRYEILSIGIAEKIDGKIVYCNLNEHNIQRDDSLGEFLNRPIFILKVKK